MTGAFSMRPLAYILAASFVLLAFVNLGGKDFWGSRAEARRAEIARTMNQTGDYLIPWLNGKKIFTKPPLFYWSVAASFVVTGGPSEGASRIPSALFALMTLALVGLMAARLYGPSEALLAPAILGTSYLFAHYMRLCELDMAFTFFISAAFYCLLMIWQNDTTLRWKIWLWVAMGLGFMVKGPYALLFPLGAWGVMTIAGKESRVKMAKAVLCEKGIVLFLLIALPWYIYVIAYDDAWQVFRGETVDRIGHNKGRDFPIYYYVTSLVNFAPWLLLLPFALVWAAAKERSENLFALAWFLAGFVIATAVTAKNYHYILPLYPALALLVARYVATALKGDFAEGWGWNRHIVTIYALLILLAVAAVLSAMPRAHLRYQALPQLDPVFAWGAFGVAAALALAGVGGAIKKRPGLLIGTAVATTLLTLLYAQALVTPALNSRHSHKGFLQEAAPRIERGEEVIMYDMRNYQVSWYLGRRAPSHYGEESLKAALVSPTKPRYIIVREKSLPQAHKLARGRVVLRDRHYVPPSPGHEEERFVLLDRGKEGS